MLRHLTDDPVRALTLPSRARLAGEMSSRSTSRGYTLAAPYAYRGAITPKTPPTGVRRQDRGAPRAVAEAKTPWLRLAGGANPAPPRPAGRVRGRVLHLVTDALPSTSAGYTIRTQEIALAQRVAGIDPHVSTRIGFPVTAGAIDGRAAVRVDGVPYHPLLPWIMPG